jgi:hypothetical protein
LQEELWNARRTWSLQRPEQDNGRHFAHNRRDAPLNRFDAFVGLTQRDPAGMHQSRAMLHVRMQLRQASQTKGTDADSNDNHRTGTG